MIFSRIWAALFITLFSTNILLSQCVSGNCWSGNGTYCFADGSRYSGQFKQGKYQGKGKYFFSDNTRYEGDFNKGVFEGKGILYYSNGSYYIGGFFNNKKHGNGTLYYTDGKKRNGLWKHGDFVQEMTYNGEVIEKTETNNSLEDVAETTTSIENKSNSYDRQVKIWAVVVGVARYTTMPSLKFTDDDAYMFYAFLKSPEGGALPDDQIRILIDEDATRGNILTTLKSILLQADENDVVMFYYSGHGLEGAFVPADFDGRNNILQHNEVMQVFKNSKAKHKVCFADACHSGSWAAMSANYTQMLNKYYSAFEQTDGGTALFLSSKSEEVSLEDSGLRSGIFSHYLIKGLRGEADVNENKIVTILELYDYVSNNVKNYTTNIQTPVLNGIFDYKMPVAVIR